MTPELSKVPLNEIVPADLDTMTATKQTLADYIAAFCTAQLLRNMVDPGRSAFAALGLPP